MRNRLKPREVNDALMNNTVPPRSVSDAGKYLGVDSSGGLEFSNPLPVTTSATTGQILKLSGETKTPTWSEEYSYTPPAYSETEVNTGQKWIDGKDIYSKVIRGNVGEIASGSTISMGVTCDYLVSSDGILSKSGSNSVSLNSYRNASVSSCTQVSAAGEVNIFVASAFSEYDYTVILRYTKPTPEPEPGPENLTKKKKTTK